MDINQIVVSGRMVNPAELKSTKNGVAVCTFSLAVEKGYGEKKSTIYLDFVAWRSRAEFISRYAQKGDTLMVVGELDINSYENKNNQKVKKAEIIVQEVKIFSSKKKGEASADSYGQYENGQSFDASQFQEVDVNDDDLPY